MATRTHLAQEAFNYVCETSPQKPWLTQKEGSAIRLLSLPTPCARFSSRQKMQRLLLGSKQVLLHLLSLG